MEPEANVEMLVDTERLPRLLFSIPWMGWIIIYVIGILISLYTRNLERFISDYPWACFTIVNMIGAWASPYFSEQHKRCTISIRKVFSVSDEKFEEILKNNMSRLTSSRNVLFGLIFLPTLLWALTQRLWWQEYNSPLFFDLYYLLNLAFMFPLYVGMMFGASFGCNLNVYKLCNEIPIDYEYIMDEGHSILRRFWGGLVGKATAVALFMSALTNVPILLYSGSMSLYLNLSIALALTTLVFIVPHYMFHRMLEKAKEEMLHRTTKLREKLSLASLEDLGKSLSDRNRTDRMLDLIFLTHYEGNLMNRHTWLVDLEAVIELLVVASVHVVFMEVLTLLAH